MAPEGMKYGYGMQEAWAGEQGLDWMPFYVPLHLEIQDSARIGFNKSSTQTREAYRHLPYSMFSYFLKSKQRSTSPWPPEAGPLVRKRNAKNETEERDEGKEGTTQGANVLKC